MRYRTMFLYLTIAWLTITGITILFIPRGDIQNNTYKNELIIPYSQAPMNFSIEVHAWANTNIMVNIELNGSFCVLLHETIIDQVEKTTLLVNNTYSNITEYHTDAGYKLNHNYHVEQYEIFIIEFYLRIPPINPDKIDDALFLMKKAYLTYDIQNFNTPIENKIAFTILNEFIGFILLLTLLSIIKRYTSRKKRKNPITVFEQDSEKRIVDELAVAKQSHLLWFNHFQTIAPSLLFITSLLLWFLFVNLNNIGQTYPSEKTSSMVVYVLSFKDINLQTISIIYLPVIIAIFGFRLENKEYEHLWSYPRARQRMFFQTEFIIMTLALIFYLILGGIILMLFFPIFLGINIFSWYALMFLLELLPHALLYIIHFNLTLSIKFFSQNDTLTIVSLSVLFLGFESLGSRVIGLTHSYYLDAWEKGVNPLPGILILLATLILSAFLISYSYQVIKVYNQ